MNRVIWKRELAWRILRALYGNSPFLFAQDVEFHGGVNTRHAPGVIHNCQFIGDGVAIGVPE